MGWMDLPNRFAAHLLDDYFPALVFQVTTATFFHYRPTYTPPPRSMAPRDG